MGEGLHFEDIGEIKRHPFFSQVNWEKMQNKSVYPPLVPAEYKGDSDEVKILSLKKFVLNGNNSLKTWKMTMIVMMME